MKQRFLSFAVLFAFALGGCSSTLSGTPAVSPSSQPGLARGAVISITRTATITKGEMNGGIAGPTIVKLGGKAQCDVAIYSVRYETIGAKGEPADANEGFYVPLAGCSGAHMLIGYAQGTNFTRAMKITDPTKQNIEPVVLAAIFAAHGYALAATEYLGLGSSTYPYQPYLVADSEASAVIDAMRAARRAARTLGVPLTKQVFLTGYSQGGHSIMATQRTAEAENSSEFDVIAGNPSSGIYALSWWIDTLLDAKSSLLFAYTLTGYEKTYGNVYSDPLQVFKDPYAKWIDTLLPVNTYAEQRKLNGTTLPVSTSALLQHAFVSNFKSDKHNGARVDYYANDLLHGWAPVAPMFLCGGSRDPVVNFDNSRRALAFFKGQGAKVTLLDVDPVVPVWVKASQYHDAVLVLCHTVERVQILDRGGWKNPSMVRLPRVPALPSSFYPPGE